MKIGYLARADIGKGSGVIKKIARQARYWQQAGHEVKIFFLTRPFEKIWTGLGNLQFEYYQTKNYFSLFHKAVELQRSIKAWNPDLIYWRYSSYYPGLPHLLKQFPTVVEINSNYNKEYRYVQNFFGYLFHRITYRRSFKYVKGFITLTQELADWVKMYDQPKLICGDSIYLSVIESLPPTSNSIPHLVLLASADFPWIAIDKIIRLGELLPDWQIHIIGLNQRDTATTKTLENVHFHGFLDSPSYKKILEQSDIAIGTLGLHRIEMDQMAPLKLREYLAYGLPSIIGYEDTDFPQGAPFLLQLPNTETNIEDNIDRIKDFVLDNMGSRVSRDQIQHIATSVKEEKKLDFFTKILEHSA